VVETAEPLIAFCLRPNAPRPRVPPLPPDYEAEFWRPRSTQLLPRGVFAPKLLILSMVHFAGGFANDDYAVFLVRNHGTVAHRSCVNPPDIRYPFMHREDLQIGFVATDPRYRGRGLATHAICAIVQHYARPDRTFWYIVAQENVASVRAVTKAGFVAHGTAIRRRSLGVIPRYDLQT
jgi:GNAT superfamily N-acetyltransferase